MIRAIKPTVIAFSCLLFTSAGIAAPDGYSVNSDSPGADADSLFRIDLATGAHVRLGRVQSQGQTRLDVEALAFAPDGTLYGLDDESMKLLPINTDNGAVLSDEEFDLSGFPVGGNNDFGMTFGCDGILYVSSVSSDSLYQLDLNGVATRIGALGSLGANISALAAFGNPVQLYGLGNGLLGDGSVDSRRLYSINIGDGVATEIGQLGGTASSYNEAGLAFDNAGQLWAITDRRAVPGGPFPSQILRVDTGTGAATAIATTTEIGFESLAVTVPRGCGTGGGEIARFTVQKRFADGNDVTPVALTLSCNTGLPLEQTIEVQPNDGPFGEYEVEFVVEQFDSGQLDCTVTESPLFGYSPTYTCLGESDCTAAQSLESCGFVEVATGTENLCQVQNYPDPVQFTIDKQWLFETEDQGIVPTARIDLTCENVFSGDGVADGSTMVWSWTVEGNALLTASLSPDFAGDTTCSAVEITQFSAIESDNGCAAPIPVEIGDPPITCSIVNTVFFEGIPTLGDLGRVLLALLLLGAGLLAVRRI